MAEFNADKLSERLRVEQLKDEQLATTKKPGRTYRFPGREVGTHTAKRLPTDQTGETEPVLDERTIIRLLEAEPPQDEDLRTIRGIGNGLALGALLWIVLIAVLVIAM